MSAFEVRSEYRIKRWCAQRLPVFLPEPEFHVETVRIHPFARFGYMKQKMRRLARERYAHYRP